MKARLICLFASLLLSSNELVSAQTPSNCNSDCQMSVTVEPYLFSGFGSCTYTAVLTWDSWLSYGGFSITRPDGSVVQTGAQDGYTDTNVYFTDPNSIYTSVSYTVTSLIDPSCSVIAQSDDFVCGSLDGGAGIFGKVKCGRFDDLAGAEISLINSTGTVVETTFTDQSGAYSFYPQVLETYIVVANSGSYGTPVGSASHTVDLSDYGHYEIDFTYFDCPCFGDALVPQGCTDIAVWSSTVCLPDDSGYQVLLYFTGINDNLGYTVTHPNGVQTDVFDNQYLSGLIDSDVYPTANFTISALGNPNCSITTGAIVPHCLQDSQCVFQVLNGDWSVASNWSSNSIPDFDCDVLIPTNSICNLPLGYTGFCHTLCVEEGGELIFQDSANLQVSQ